MLEFKNDKKLNEEITKLTKITTIISITRLVLALNIIVWILCLISLDKYVLYGIIEGVSILALLVFVFLTNKFFSRLSERKQLLLVYKNHNKRRNLDFNGFFDEGRDFINKEDYKLSDLDIFGPKSLFQYLTVCKTKLGRDSLAKSLSNPDKKDIKFTESIYEMAESEDTLRIEAALLEFNESAKNINYDDFKSVVKSKIKINPLSFLSLLSFIGMIVYLIVALIAKINIYYVFAFVAGNVITSMLFIRNEVFDLDAIKYNSMCSAYTDLASTILTIDYKSEYLITLKSKIEAHYNDIKRLKKVYLALATRKNTVANVALNLVCVYDFWTVFIYNRLSKNIGDLDELFESIAEIEVMASYANIGIDNEVYSIPTESEVINAGEMYHPLVKNCISNTITVDGGIVLTGSNMSGKTTFMRTLGINQVLYNAGSIVCAKSFSSSYLPVFTSLRANDMLSEGISTFYAEILRMKKMNEAIREGECLILVDEIFKGTNAVERINASIQVIDKFNEYHRYFIISTHDFEICDAKNITNYHFNESYEDDKIKFDYKIKTGKCQSTNALYLLKMSGIIE